MVNRGAMLLRYKAPAVQWINEADPVEGNRDVTLELVNEERTVYLISDRAGDDSASFHRWLRRNYLHFFELELEGWYVDETLWPADRSFKRFEEWFDVEVHTVVVDTAGGELVDDGL